MYVIKFGGSRLRPKEKEVDESCVRFLIDLAKNHSENKFLFIIGGGALARELQKEGLGELNELYDPDQDLLEQGKDLLGIKATRENGRLLIERFQKENINICPKLLIDPTAGLPGEFQIYIAGGWKPGWSTDYVAMKFAQKYNSKKVIKVSDFSYVKDISPLELKDLKEEEINNKLGQTKNLKDITWKKIADLVGTKWIPGLHTPLDPLAAALGLKNQHITLYIVPENQIESILQNDKGVKGTIIHN